MSFIAHMKEIALSSFLQPLFFVVHIISMKRCSPRSVISLRNETCFEEHEIPDDREAFYLKNVGQIHENDFN